MSPYLPGTEQVADDNLPNGAMRTVCKAEAARASEADRSFLNCLYWIWASFVAVASSPLDADSFALQLFMNTSPQGLRVSWVPGQVLCKFFPHSSARAPPTLLPLHLPLLFCQSVSGLIHSPRQALPVLRQLRNSEERLWHRQSCFSF